MPGNPWTPQPFARVSASDHVLGTLRKAIVDGELPPGTQLRETRIAGLVQTGRGPVREAIRQLVQEGLAEHELHRGVFVRTLSATERLDVYAARLVIETGVVRQLLGSDPLPDLRPLRGACDAIAAAATTATADAKPSERMIESDIEFHRQLIGLAGSERLSRTYETLAAETLILLRHHPPYSAIDYADSHRLIVTALADRDPRALELVEQHLRLSVRLIAAELDREAAASTTELPTPTTTTPTTATTGRRQHPPPPGGDHR